MPQTKSPTETNNPWVVKIIVPKSSTGHTSRWFDKKILADPQNSLVYFEKTLIIAFKDAGEQVSDIEFSHSFLLSITIKVSDYDPAYSVEQRLRYWNNERLAEEDDAVFVALDESGQLCLPNGPLLQEAMDSFAWVNEHHIQVTPLTLIHVLMPA